MRAILFTVASFLIFWGLDAYVLRNWRRFASGKRNLAWTLPVYRVFLWVMPIVIPVYFLTSRWWDVEPKLLRQVVIGFWAFYYLPKVPLVAVLLLKDIGRIFQYVVVKARSRQAVQSAAPRQGAGPNMNRAEFVRRVGWTAAVIPFAAVGNGILGSLYDFHVHRVTLPLPHLPKALDGLTIAQVSDIHAGSFFSPRPVNDAFALLQELRPDLITITGDYVNHDISEMPVILPALRALKADLGVFGCLGNHDHYAQLEPLIAQIRSTPVNLLVNAHQSLRIGDARLHLVGTDNTGFRQHYGDLAAATRGLAPDEQGEDFRILLAHDPSYWDMEVRPRYPDIDLMLCGHTHGGQIGFEFGPLRWSIAQTVYDRWAGLYSEPVAGTDRYQHLYVNRGLGTVGPPIRVGIPPEITFITLKRT